MVLKGLAVGGAIAAVAIAVFAALTLRLAPPTATMATEPAPAVNAVVLPNGVAAPQLQPVQPASAPALVNDVSLVSLVGMARESAELNAMQLSAEKSTSAAASEAKLYAGCSGD